MCDATAQVCGDSLLAVCNEGGRPKGDLVTCQKTLEGTVPNGTVLPLAFLQVLHAVCADAPEATDLKGSSRVMGPPWVGPRKVARGVRLSGLYARTL